MKPLNGKCGMTPDEKRERRRELMRDPEYRARVNKTKRAWWFRNRGEIAMRKKALLAALTPDEREARKAERRAKAKVYRAEHKAEISARMKAWRAANHDKVQEYNRRRDIREKANGMRAKRIARHAAARRQRMLTDPEYRAHHLAVNRAWRLTAKGIAHKKRRTIIDWIEVAEGGPARIADYMRKARQENRKAFVRWYSTRQLIDRTHGLGSIEQKADEEVAR